MTAIVGVLNSRAFVIAADSAVTVTASNVKKVYNRSNKIFTLSKFQPVGIAIYSSADFMGIPLETIIKLYRKKLKDASFPTLEEYKKDFLAFLIQQLNNVSSEIKRDTFYNFYNQTYHGIINAVIQKLDGIAELEKQTAAELEATYEKVISDEISLQQVNVDRLNKKNYIEKTFDEYSICNELNLTSITDYLQQQIQQKYPVLRLNQTHIDGLRNLFYSMINVELIFESLNGLVFFGFGESEIYPSTSQVLIGATICDIPRIRYFDPIKIIPGQMNANIIPYAQADVTNTVLTGVDPNYLKEMQETIRSSFQTFGEEIQKTFNDSTLSEPIVRLANSIPKQIIDRLNDFQFGTITGPLLEILAHMGKEDMSELAESLVNITSLKRKFTSSDSGDESVGGPVDVAVVTKGDGFIWMKRKQYFDIQNNPGFIEKYYKI
jgi:DNA-binding MarR family transcriptional regulator